MVLTRPTGNLLLQPESIKRTNYAKKKKEEEGVTNKPEKSQGILAKSSMGTVWLNLPH